MMDEVAVLKKLGPMARLELTNNILVYWQNHVIDKKYGGFIGRVAFDNTIDSEAPKGSILNARILWTFSSCFRLVGTERLKSLADSAYEYFTTHFFDERSGGVYWMLKSDGTVLDGRKHIYAQSFAIYALTEYYRIFGKMDALERALTLYELVESKSADRTNGGYFEAFSRDWELHDDSRLSDKDANEPKSMNTHLHLMEAYTNLYRCAATPRLRDRLVSLIELFLEKIIAEDGSHLINFLDENWEARSETISFGHDIEASWLLMEAAGVVDDERLSEQVTMAATKLCHSVLHNGMDIDGGLMTEADRNGITNDDKEWWPQGEAAVGFLNIFELTGETKFLDAALNTWMFIDKHIVDLKYGDWLGRVDRNGKPYQDDKVNEWKCCYHNARTCLEVISRTNRLLKERGYKIKTSIQPS